ncbi:MAG TPA: complex I subunit 1 family protein, partial [Acidimicrobiia bacterium]|nr:complex I subunit 1 family protein [Acidimicrobiia bacterium]
MTFVDPLVGGNFDLTVVLIVIGKTIATFALLLVAVLFYIWFLRKAIADMQNRIGPYNAGPFGILQTLADGIKLFFKEQSIPRSADKPVFLIAPYLSILPAFLAFSIVPIGGLVSIAGHKTYLQLAELPVGVLWLLAMSGLGLYGVMLAGWSSGSKYPLLGSVRASAQMVSYEAGLGLSIATVLVVCGTLSTNGIVVAQDGIRNWNIIATGVVPFIVFFLAITAEMNRPPFDLTEAEQELV